MESTRVHDKTQDSKQRHPQNFNVTHKQLRCVCTNPQGILRAVRVTFTPRPSTSVPNEQQA